jgi:hypothetical protein
VKCPTPGPTLFRCGSPRDGKRKQPTITSQVALGAAPVELAFARAFARGFSNRRIAGGQASLAQPSVVGAPICVAVPRRAAESIAGASACAMACSSSRVKKKISSRVAIAPCLARKSPTRNRARRMTGQARVNGSTTAARKRTASWAAARDAAERPARRGLAAKAERAAASACLRCDSTH